MTHIPSSFALQDVAFSLVVDEPELRLAPQPAPKAKRSIFSFFRSLSWEQLCPDLERELTVGTSRFG